MNKTFLVVALALSFIGSAYAQHGAERHVAKGIPCQACHGENLKEPQEPTIETCTQCHPTQALVAKTAKVKPTNPHTSPHYADKLDCVNCHLMHSDSENYCANCHTFDFKVP